MGIHQPLVHGLVGQKSKNRGFSVQTLFYLVMSPNLYSDKFQKLQQVEKF